MNTRPLLFLLALLAAPMIRAEGFLMWQAERDGRTVHLVANIPFIADDLLPSLDPAIYRAFDASPLVVFASDPDPDRQRANRRAIVEAGKYPEGESLRDHLPPKTARQLDTLATDLAISTRGIQQLRPWLAAENLLNIAAVHAKIRHTDSLDRMFHSRASREGKTIGFLQTPQETIALHEALSDDEQIRLFEKTLRDVPRTAELLRRIEAAWRASDPEAAAAIYVENFAGFEDLHTALFAERNRAWAEKLETQSGFEDPVFALIGLSHLVGPHNLLDQLAARGYRIAQVLPE
jgi:uncharacterized protein YbaP (TraB family)